MHRKIIRAINQMDTMWTGTIHIIVFQEDDDIDLFLKWEMKELLIAAVVSVSAEAAHRVHGGDKRFFLF